MGTNLYQPFSRLSRQLRETDGCKYVWLLSLLFVISPFGYLQAQVNVGDRVFLDFNRNGIQDDGPANGLNGVKVQLWSAGLDKQISTDDVLEATEFTANNVASEPGYFLFVNVQPGYYYLKFPTQEGRYYLSPSNQGAEATDSDADILYGSTAVFRVDNADVLEVDAGFALLSPFCASVCSGTHTQTHLVQTLFGPVNNPAYLNTILNVPQFDATLGELLRVDVQTRITYKHRYRIENLDVDSAFTAKYTSLDSAKMSGFGVNPSPINQSTIILDDYLLAANPSGSADFMGPDYVEGDTAYIILRDDTTTIDAADLAAFTGNGTIPYLFDARGGSIIASSNNLFLSIQKRVRYEVIVRYVYCKPVCGSIGDFVWNDLNKDGIQDPGEVGIAGVTVTLYDVTGKITGVTTTDAYGKYLFTNVQPGTYSVGFTLPTDYNFSPQNVGADDALDSDPDPLRGITQPFVLDTLQNITDVDAGMYFNPRKLKANLGNRVWLDQNANGVQDAGEPGVADVSVSLYEAVTDRLLFTTVTDAQGEYYFRNLDAGDYYVRITPPTGYTLTLQDQGGNDELDSDIQPSTGRTTDISLADGQNDYSWDAGIVRIPTSVATVGDFVWHDLDKDGTQDVNEPGIPNARVELYDALTDALIATTFTDGLGYYQFTVQIDLGGGVLRTGYYVIFTVANPSYIPTLQDQGAYDNKDSDANTGGKTEVFILNEGDTKTDIDAGYYDIAPPGTASLGDYVWFDINKDGIQSSSEIGAKGITAVLLDATNQEISRTTTDINGYYLFADLPAAIYKVQFLNLPLNTAWTLPLQGANPALDSDVNPGTSITNPINLANGEINLTVDAGIITKLTEGGNASLGNFVWDDVNQDGIQDANEPGVGGVEVEIRNVSNTFTQTTQTDGAGFYIFNDLFPDSYIVTFSNLPTGYAFTTANAGGEDAKDSDADALGETPVVALVEGEANMTVDAGIVKSDPLLATVGDFVWDDFNQNGLQDLNEVGVSGIAVVLFDETNTLVSATRTNSDGRYLFTNLQPGIYKILFTSLPDDYVFTTPASPSISDPANEDKDSDADASVDLLGQTHPFTLAAGQTNLDVDAGIVNNRAEIGDYVWNDLDEDGSQEAGEPGLSGITVVLKDDLGNKVSSTVTNADGYYYFRNLNPGNYQLTFTDTPPGAAFTIQDANANTTDERDSDVNPTDATIPTFAVNSGDRNYDFDAGLVVPVRSTLKGVVWYDNDIDGQRQGNEPRVPGVTVTLLDASNNPVAVAVTGADGVYFFDNLLPGIYSVIFSTFPAGSSLTVLNVGDDATDSDLSPLSLNPLVATGGSVTIGKAQNVDGPDGGLIPPAGIRGRAWTDNNQNGIREPSLGDVGIPGVGVTLLNEFGTPLRRSSTTEGGRYEFLGLAPGQRYAVRFDSIPDRAWTRKNIGDPAFDSDAKSSGTPDAGTTDLLAPALLPNEIRPNIDAGYLTPGTPFPIELLSFAGRLRSEDVLLNWVTANETNSSEFVILRSTDGFNGGIVMEVGAVNAAGNSTSERSYQFTDYNISSLNASTIWYRLKMVDLDGTQKLSKPIEIRLDDSNGKIFLESYPNPVSDALTVNYQLFEGRHGEISVFNTLGQVVFTKSIKQDKDLQTLTIDVKDWQSGVYFLEVNTDNARTTKRIFVE